MALFNWFEKEGHVIVQIRQRQMARLDLLIGDLTKACRSLYPASFTCVGICRQSSMVSEAPLRSFLGGSGRRAGYGRGSQPLLVRADADYYSTLGVDKSADKKAIKQAYR